METSRLPYSPADGTAPRQAAVVGLNRETADLLPSLLDAPGIQVIRILNPDLEDVGRLTQFPNLSIIIDTTRSPAVASRLRRLPLRKVDVISAMGARILFGSLKPTSSRGEGVGEHVRRCMAEVREAVSVHRGRGEILKAILGAAVKATEADRGSLMLLDAARRQLTIEAAVGLEDQMVLSAVQKVGRGVSGTAIRRGESILIQGAADREAYAAEYQSPGLVSSICCPLLYGEEAVGVLNVASSRPGRVFGPEDVAFLEDLARLTADVIKASKEGEPGAHASQGPGLLASAREILAMPYRLEERLNLLLMKVANSLGANQCSYYEFCAEEGVFVATASSASGIGPLREKTKLLDDFFAQRVIKTDNTFCVNAAGKGPRDKKWYILQPIRNGQELAGTLFVQLNSEKNALKEETAALRRIGELLSREVARNREREAVKSQSLKLSAISQFAYDQDSVTDLGELGRMLLSNVRLILEAETCVLRLCNRAGEEPRVFDTLSHRNPAWLKDILDLDERIVADLGPGRSVALFPDLRESPYSGDLLGSESALVAALEADGRVVGILSLYDKKPQDIFGSPGFGESDREVLLNFAAQAARGLKRFHPFPAPASWQPA